MADEKAGRRRRRRRKGKEEVKKAGFAANIEEGLEAKPAG